MKKTARRGRRCIKQRRPDEQRERAAAISLNTREEARVLLPQTNTPFTPIRTQRNCGAWSDSHHSKHQSMYPSCPSPCRLLSVTLFTVCTPTDGSVVIVQHPLRSMGMRSHFPKNSARGIQLHNPQRDAPPPSKTETTATSTETPRKRRICTCTRKYAQGEFYTHHGEFKRSSFQTVKEFCRRREGANTF